tara:strand:+ start:94 stop:585 length:492 start_codon:yes stop_codon:yes gene_type:complete
MSTDEFPANERNLKRSVSAIRHLSQWQQDSIDAINRELGEQNEKPGDLRLIRRINLENLKTDAYRTRQLLEIQQRRHNEELNEIQKDVKNLRERYNNSMVSTLQRLENQINEYNELYAFIREQGGQLLATYENDRRRRQAGSAPGMLQSKKMDLLLRRHRFKY